MSARLAAPLPVRFACLTHDLGKGTTPPEVLPKHTGHEQRSAELLKTVCNRLRVPNECGAAALVRLLERCDAFRKPQRFEQVLLACECDARGRLGMEEAPYPPRDRLLAALKAARAVDTAAIAAEARERGLLGDQIGQRIQQARAQAVAQSLQTSRASAA
jgi:tRNA nucleotidyltransferase (CCA-adding enzyme)